MRRKEKGWGCGVVGGKVKCNYRRLERMIYR